MPQMRSLREHVETEGPLGVLEAVGWITRAAKTVAIIHEEKRVHGSINADAILITPGNCHGAGALAHPEDVRDVREYYSRRRASGGEATRADDVWALCVTLFYALTGALPFPRGVLPWLKADKRQPPPIAVHGADLAVMEVVLAKLLDPRGTSGGSPPAGVLVLQLRGLSPRAGDLPPLALRDPQAADLDPDIPLPPALPEIRMGDIVIVSPDIDGATPAPSAALLASLPPAPMQAPEQAAAPALPQRVRWLIAGLGVLLLLAIAAAVVGFLR